MKIFKSIWFSILLFSGIVTAQIGIGTITPDTSALLDLSSTSKGLLIPRMTTAQQDSIVNPAIGLTIFNLSTGQLEFNKGDGSGGSVWVAASGTGNGSSSAINVVASGTTASTTIDSDTVVSEMTLSPGAGTYAVSFNGEYSIDPGNTASFITTAQGVLDLIAAYNQLHLMTPNKTHAVAFGLGEILTPGVYATDDSTIAGSLTLDAQNDPTQLFIFKINGALGVGDATTINLINGAQARNVFWVAEGAISIGASSIVKGTFLSHAGAVAMASSCILEGRLLATGSGAVNTVSSTIKVPLNTSVINLGILSVFALFSTSGALGNTGTSFVTGDVGSDAGAITNYNASANCLIFGPTTAPYPFNNAIFATFSIYQNNTIIPTSARTVISNAFKSDVITVLSKATITAGQSIDVRWNTNLGTLSLANRTFILIKMQ